MLERVHAVRLDSANNKLRAIAPIIREHGVEYERSHFKKKLEAKNLTMALTEQWITHTVNCLIRSKDARVSHEKLLGGAREDFEAVLFIAMADLIAEYPHWGGEQRSKEKEDTVPETMQLDLLRIKTLNEHFHANIVSIIILITVDQEVKTHMRDGIVRSQLLKSVSDAVVRTHPKPSNVEQTISAVNEQLIGYIAEADIKIIVSLLHKHITRNHPVYIHMVSLLFFQAIGFDFFSYLTLLCSGEEL